MKFAIGDKVWFRGRRNKRLPGIVSGYNRLDENTVLWDHNGDIVTRENEILYVIIWTDDQRYGNESESIRERHLEPRN